MADVTENGSMLNPWISYLSVKKTPPSMGESSLSEWIVRSGGQVLNWQADRD